jgi:16S rRNA (cytosine967-C5)-methyltransferase
MKLTSLVNHAAEVLGSILKTFPEGGSVRAVPPDAVIASFFRSRKYLGSHDRRFIAESVYGTIRHLRRIDALLTHSLREIQASGSATDALPRVLVYLLQIDDGRTEERSRELLEAYGGEVPSESDLPRAWSDGRSKEPALDLADRHSFPPWMVQRFIESYGLEEAEALCRVLNTQAPMTIRANTHKTDRSQLQRLLSTRGLETRPTTYSPLGLIFTKRTNVFALDAFREGMFEVQDEGSQLLPLLIDPKPTAKVLDACAGAGGKALELSALMKNRGEILATDISPRRLEELRRRAKRAGAHNIRIREEDYTSPPSVDTRPLFDHVLLDAPCSGTGTIRRNPGLKWTISQESVAELVLKQVSLLAATSRYVKPGGVIWYCTCSLLPQENEGVVERFLSTESSFAILDPASLAERLGLADAVSGSAVHLLPHRHGTDGFFCAALQRMT